jgi:diguanylate cyclase (GGDEF)-like protein
MATLSQDLPEYDRLRALLQQAGSLSASLFADQSLADVRRLAVSSASVLADGPALLLAYDPAIPYLRVEEHGGIASPLAKAFRFEVGESFMAEVWEQAARSGDPERLRVALQRDLGLRSPVIHPLGSPSKLRGLLVVDPRVDGPAKELSSFVLRQFGAVVSGAFMAAEAHAASERIGVLDPVTGLLDRHSAETYLRRELARARRYREPLSLVFIDLDRFGELNDRRGYAFGDHALREIAKLLVGFPSTSREMTGIALCFRESDLAARVGADEFLVLLPATPRAGASQAAERFLAGLRQHRVVFRDGGPESVGITATAAVVTFPEDGDSAEGLTHLASELVTEAARSGGDRLVVSPSQQLPGRPPGRDVVVP